MEKNDDRLSELPDSLILDILRFLPTTEVVRTTILSQRWKNLWTTIPRLEFNESSEISSDKFRSFVHGALNAWRGIKIEELDFLSQSPITSSDIDSLLQFATDKKVEHLSLSLPDSPRLYSVPQHLYSCSSLRTLSLKNCDLRIDQVNGNVRWDKLEWLEIFCMGVDENSMDQIMRGSPRLEGLLLFLCKSAENLNIRSASLRAIAIRTGKSSELTIRAPNLEKFIITGAPLRKCLLMDVSSLSKADLDFEDDLIVGDLMSQILPALKNVKSVTLSHWCIKAIGASKENYMPLSNAKYLELSIRDQEYHGLVRVLEMFPKLRNLVIDTFQHQPEDEGSCIKLDSNPPSFFLHKLTRVDINWVVGDDSIFPLIQILLKYAVKLKKLYFRVQGMEPLSAPWEPLFMASQKLLRMPRSSPRAKLIVDHAILS